MMTDEEREAERILQRKANRLVEREVHYCLSGWMHFAINAQFEVGRHLMELCPAEVEDIPLDLPCEECHGTGFEVYRDAAGEVVLEGGEYRYTTRTEASDLCDPAFRPHDNLVRVPSLDSIEWEEATCGDHEGDYIAVNGAESCNECDGGRVNVEVYEWWAVSRYLAEKLEAAGEVVLGGEIWGRQGTGQAIAMDGVIRDFARELGDAWAV